MARKIPKDHKEKIIDIDYWSWDHRSVYEIIEEIEEQVSEMAQPVVVFRWGEPSIAGFVPMTELEIMQAKARRAASRKANAAKKEKQEAEERALYEKLKEKFDVPS
jgi:hypothetical protein